MPWLCAGFAVSATWYAISGRLPDTGANIDLPILRYSSMLIAAGVLCVSYGVGQYLGLPRGHLRWLVLACGLPGVALMTALAFGATVPHHVFHVGVLVAYVGAAVLAFRRAAEAPGDGHALLGLTLLTLVGLPFVMASAGVPPSQLKYFAGLSLSVFGMVLLTVSFMRRHRSLREEVQRRQAAETLLREANARLEARVSERTAHLSELVKGLETFNRGVSHDLRGPLGGMSNLARLATDAMARGDDSVARRALPAIARQCDDSMNMVSTMLELARIGDMQVQREPVCLSDLARSAYDEVLLGVAEGPVPELRYESMPLIHADPRLLRSVFVNLLGNAAKFSRHVPSPCIHVDAHAKGNDIEVCVRDNGVGFDPQKAQRIFEPFVRAHSSRFEGHGLGLSIVRRAVEAMGGTAWATSSVDGGASLCFRIPDALSGAGQDAAADLQPTPTVAHT